MSRDAIGTLGEAFGVQGCPFAPRKEASLALTATTWYGMFRQLGDEA
jgi:hypothetical protein